MNHFRGKVLAVHSDCSFAGHWLKEFQDFPDKQGVQPCGHSARDKGILIKVFTSCQSNEIPCRVLYSIRANKNDKDKGGCFIKENNFEVAYAQHLKHIDSTITRCNNDSIDEKCTLKPGYNWHKWNIEERIYLVRGEEGGRLCTSC